MEAVIDRRAFERHGPIVDHAHAHSSITVLSGGTYDDTVGYFVRPTNLECDDPRAEVFTTEFFGPILAVHVYTDVGFVHVVDLIDTTTPFGLTGSIIAQDRAAIACATGRLRFTAGNFYINDKPTGAVVGQQPFGGSRASATNDKTAAPRNLRRWTSTRAVKETFAPSLPPELSPRLIGSRCRQ